MPLSIEAITLAIIIGTLLAIVYSLRVLVLLERRMARMDENLIKITRAIVRGESEIMSEEKKIERLIKR